MTMSPIGFGKKGYGKRKSKLKGIGAGKKGTSQKVRASLDSYKQTKTINKWLKEMK